MKSKNEEERASVPKQLFISDEAFGDLEDIWTYIAQDSFRNADGFIDQLYRKCIEIAELDAIGRKRDELFPGLLSLAYKKYIIFFLRTKERVEIVRILLGSRDLQKQFDKTYGGNG
jgi:toxin ParE1/3/4